MHGRSDGYKAAGKPMGRQIKNKKNAKIKSKDEAIKRFNRDISQIERYLRDVEIQIRAEPQTREDLIRALKNSSPGESIKAMAFIRHRYTNYENICQYVYNRWGRGVSPDLKQKILHPKCRVLIRKYLESINAIDLIQDGPFAIRRWRQ
jgi:hypothetical protein